MSGRMTNSAREGMAYIREEPETMNTLRGATRCARRARGRDSARVARTAGTTCRRWATR